MERTTARVQTPWSTSIPRSTGRHRGIEVRRDRGFGFEGDLPATSAETVGLGVAVEQKSALMNVGEVGGWNAYRLPKLEVPLAVLQASQQQCPTQIQSCRWRCRGVVQSPDSLECRGSIVVDVGMGDRESGVRRGGGGIGHVLILAVALLN